MQFQTAALFVGRQSELAEITRLLSDPACRLLTLVGPGGIGKTRLAVEATRQVAAAEDVRFVALQPLASTEHILPALADALDFHFYSGHDPEEQILNYLSDKSYLLILDNFEHLLDSAPLLSKILIHSPGVRMLATSRERLDLVEEWVLEVGGLTYPSQESDADLERYSAIELFLHHARRVKAGFALDEARKPLVIRICRLLGGMPLGIELAAAWVRALTCEQIAHEIEHSLNILETSTRNIEPRHRNMRVVFEPTWARLSDEERAVFRKLSVFRGGCTLEAAESVAGATLRVVSALVDKSLLRLDISGRYDLHELPRQYGEEQLNACGEADTTRDAHCAYFAALLDRLTLELKGPTQIRALDQLEAELDNVRLSWRWAVRQRKEREVRQSLDGLVLFYQTHTRYAEGSEAFELAVNGFGDVENELLGLLLLGLGWFLQNGYEIKELLCIQRALPIIRREGVYVTMTMLLQQFAYFVDALGGYEVLHQLYHDYLIAAMQRGDEWGAAWALHCLGYVAFWVSKYSEAVPYFQESLTRFRVLGDRWGSSWQIGSLGRVARLSNNFTEARQYHLESLELCRQLGDKRGIAYSYWQLGLVARGLGEPEVSRQYTIDSLKIGLEIGSPGEIWEAIDYAAWHLMEAEKRLEQTVELYALLRHSNLHTDAKNRVERQLETLKAELPPEVFAAAVRRGEARNLKATVIELLEQLTAIHQQADAGVRDVASSTDLHDHLLTERELEILRLVADGLSNREIADQLVLATSTIKWYINEIFSKLDATSRTQAVARAKTLGLLS